MTPSALVRRTSVTDHSVQRRAEPARARPIAARVAIWLALGLAGWTTIASVLVAAVRLVG